MPRSSLIRIFLAAFLLAAFSLQAQKLQTVNDGNFRNRVSIGGSFGLQFGTVTAINVAPEALIRVVDQLHVGVGFSYSYLQANKYFWDDVNQRYLDYKANIFGGRIFARYYLRSLLDNFLGDFFGHVEYEYLYYTRPYKPDPNGRIYDPYAYTYSAGTDIMEINSLFVGGGYEQNLGGKAYIDLMILFNVNETYYSPYSNPIFRLGFGVRL
jgi:hypothetical protein